MFAPEKKGAAATDDLAKSRATLRISVPGDWTIASETSELYAWVRKNYSADGLDYAVRFVAAGPRSRTEEDYVLAVLSSWSLVGEYTAEDIASATFGNYEREADALMVHGQTISLGDRPARRQELRWDEKHPDGTTNTRWSTQFFVVRGHEVFWLEFTTDWHRRPELTETLDRIAASLRLP